MKSLDASIINVEGYNGHFVSSADCKCRHIALMIVYGFRPYFPSLWPEWSLSSESIAAILMLRFGYAGIWIYMWCKWNNNLYKSSNKKCNYFHSIQDLVLHILFHWLWQTLKNPNVMHLSSVDTFDFFRYLQWQFQFNNNCILCNSFIQIHPSFFVKLILLSMFKWCYFRTLKSIHQKFLWIYKITSFSNEDSISSCAHTCELLHFNVDYKFHIIISTLSKWTLCL